MTSTSPAPTHACDSGTFDRTLCPEPCGAMHSYCTICGTLADPCEHIGGDTIFDIPSMPTPAGEIVPEIVRVSCTPRTCEGARLAHGRGLEGAETMEILAKALGYAAADQDLIGATPWPHSASTGDHILPLWRKRPPPGSPTSKPASTSPDRRLNPPLPPAADLDALG